MKLLEDMRLHTGFRSEMIFDYTNSVLIEQNGRLFWDKVEVIVYYSRIEPAVKYIELTSVLARPDLNFQQLMDSMR